MITNNSAYSGLPSEAELTALANQLFPDIDGSLFEPEACLNGIENLVSSGDTGVFDTASEKAARAFGEPLGYGDFENIIEDLKEDTNFDVMSGVSSEYPGFTGMDGAFRNPNNYTPQSDRKFPEKLHPCL